MRYCRRPKPRYKMLPDDHPDRIQIAFDDHRLVANAGLILPATLALHLGLPEQTAANLPVYPNSSPDHRACNSLTLLPLSSRRPSVSIGGFGLTDQVMKHPISALTVRHVLIGTQDQRYFRVSSGRYAPMQLEEHQTTGVPELLLYSIPVFDERDRVLCTIPTLLIGTLNHQVEISGRQSRPLERWKQLVEQRRLQGFKYGSYIVLNRSQISLGGCVFGNN